IVFISETSLLGPSEPARSIKILKKRLYPRLGVGFGARKGHAKREALLLRYPLRPAYHARRSNLLPRLQRNRQAQLGIDIERVPREQLAPLRAQIEQPPRY